jgi:hypothetical protein
MDQCHRDGGHLGQLFELGPFVIPGASRGLAGRDA